MIGLDGVSWRGFWANWGPHWNTTKQQRERMLKPSLGPTATRNLVFYLFLDIKYSTKCSLKVSAISARGLSWIYQHGAQSYHHCDIELSFRIFKSQSVPKRIPVDLEQNKNGAYLGYFLLASMRFASWYKMSVTPKLSDFRTVALILSTNVGPCS